MDENYRQKIVHWLTSALLVTTFFVLALCAKWFVVLPNQHWLGNSDSSALQLIGLVDGPLAFYYMTLLPAFVWHLGDFFELHRPVPFFLTNLTRYRTQLTCLFTLGCSIVLESTGWFMVSGSCGGKFTMLSQVCMWTHPAVAAPLLASFILLWVVGVLKLAVGLTSRLGPTR